MRTLVVVMGAVLLAGCVVESAGPPPLPPGTPFGVFAVSGDNFADIYWEPATGYVIGYDVYVSDRYNGRYDRIGSTGGTFFRDNGARNGVTYYYAVSAFDGYGISSPLSVEEAVATPRPEGYNVLLRNVRSAPGLAGFSFASFTVVPWDVTLADIYYDYDSGVPYMVAYGDIQDMGPTRDLYDVPVAPSTGWSPTQDVVLRGGYTYVVWTEDNYYAKFRVRSIAPDNVVFDFAYQLQQGNPLLKRDGDGVRHRTHVLRTR